MAMDSLEKEARERKKKAIALTALPLCMGFFMWRLQSTTSAAPRPKTPPPPIVKQAAPQVAQAAGPVINLEKQKIVSVPLGDKDPFIPGVVATPPSATAPAKANAGKPVRVAELLPGKVGLPLPSADLKAFPPMPPAQPAQPVEPAAQKPAVPPVPITPVPPAVPARPVMPYVLTGIVKGNPDVAILRHTDGSRRIARMGDALDNNYRVLAIEETSVVLSGHGETNMLRLGGVR